MEHEREKGLAFSAPTKLLLLPEESRVPCYRTLVSPGVPSGLWILQLLETTHEYVVSIIQRIPAIKKHGTNSCLVQCGGGYDMLVLLNGAPIPPDVSKIPSMRVSVFLTSGSDTPPPTDPSDNFGTIKPRETIWQHFHCQIQQGASGDSIRIYLEAYTPRISKSEQYDQKVDKRVMRLLVNPSDSWTVVSVDSEAGKPNDFAARSEVIAVTPQGTAPATVKTRKPGASKSKVPVDKAEINGNEMAGYRREESLFKKRPHETKKATLPADEDKVALDAVHADTPSGNAYVKGFAKVAKKPKVAETSLKSNTYGFNRKELLSLEAAYEEEVLGDDDNEAEILEGATRKETPKKSRATKKRED